MLEVENIHILHQSNEILHIFVELFISFLVSHHHSKWVVHVFSIEPISERPVLNKLEVIVTFGRATTRELSRIQSAGASFISMTDISTLTCGKESLWNIVHCIVNE